MSAAATCLRAVFLASVATASYKSMIKALAVRPRAFSRAGRFKSGIKKTEQRSHATREDIIETSNME